MHELRCQQHHQDSLNGATPRHEKLVGSASEGLGVRDNSAASLPGISLPVCKSAYGHVIRAGSTLLVASVLLVLAPPMYCCQSSLVVRDDFVVGLDLWRLPFDVVWGGKPGVLAEL